MHYRDAAPATSVLVTPLLFIAYLIGKPFYFFPGGGVQVADLIIAALFLLTLLGRQAITRGTAPFVWACVLFSTYTFIVNWLWAFVLNDISMLMAPTYYFFNTVVVYVILTLDRRIEGGVLKVMLVGIVASAALQALLTIWFVDTGRYRQILFFYDNSNRLGYWALLSGTIFCVIANRMNIRMLFQIPFLLIILYLVALSLSKAALLGMFLLFAIHLSRNIWQFLVIALISVIALYFLSDLTLIQHVVDRLNNIGHQADDSLHGRGYDRIWLHSQYLLFGAGEKGLSRFSETNIELHSTLGTVLFGYGVIGVFLFGLLLWRLFKLAGWREFMYIGPIFVYGVAHQGLRFSLLWVLFALIAVRPAWEASQSQNQPGRQLE